MNAAGETSFATLARSASLLVLSLVLAGCSPESQPQGPEIIPPSSSRLEAKSDRLAHQKKLGDITRRVSSGGKYDAEEYSYVISKLSSRDIVQLSHASLALAVYYQTALITDDQVFQDLEPVLISAESGDVYFLLSSLLQELSSFNGGDWQDLKVNRAGYNLRGDRPSEITAEDKTFLQRIATLRRETDPLIGSILLLGKRGLGSSDRQLGRAWLESARTRAKSKSLQGYWALSLRVFDARNPVQ